MQFYHMLFQNTHVYINGVNACIGRINTKFSIVVAFVGESVKKSAIKERSESFNYFCYFYFPR